MRWDRYHIPIVAVTLGGRGSIVRTQDRLYRVHSPQVRVFNTVGCGDCFVAGLLHGFAQGVCLEDNLRYATAAGAAMAEEALSVNFRPGRAVALCSKCALSGYKAAACRASWPRMVLPQGALRSAHAAPACIL